MMPPVGSPRGLAAPPASRDEVAGGGRRSLGLLGRQAVPLSLDASQMEKHFLCTSLHLPIRGGREDGRFGSWTPRLSLSTRFLRSEEERFQTVHNGVAENLISSETLCPPTPST